MPPVCMFEILEMPADTLKKLLPKASSKSLVLILSAYPRTAGRLFITVLTDCLSAPTMAFLQDEINRSQTPSFGQIREAERELLKIIQELQLVAQPA